MKSLGLMSLVCAATLSLACNTDTRSDTTATGNEIGAAGDLGIDRGDRDFVQKMMQSGMAEVQLGELASQRAASAEVKQFGQTLMRDHQQANDALRAIAMQYNIQPGEVTLDDDHRDLIERLSKLQGAEFDREFVSAMVDGHEDVIDELEGRVDKRDVVGTTGDGRDANVTAEQSDDPFEASLNQWAARTLPVVQGHLEQARSLEQRLEQSARR